MVALSHQHVLQYRCQYSDHYRTMSVIGQLCGPSGNTTLPHKNKCTHPFLHVLRTRTRTTVSNMCPLGAITPHSHSTNCTCYQSHSSSPHGSPMTFGASHEVSRFALSLDHQLLIFTRFFVSLLFEPSPLCPQISPFSNQ